MTLKTFCLKRGIIFHNIKRFWWVSALYAFFLFLCEPYQLMTSQERLLERLAMFPDVMQHQLAKNEITFILLIGAAILLGICVMRYLQTVRSATLFHALPTTRLQLYLSSVASGFVLLAVPILLNGIVLLFMSLFGGFSPIFSALEVIDWAGSQLLTGTATLCFCILMGMFTGSSAAQLVYVFAISFVPLGVVSLLAEIFDGWLFGFTSTGINPVIEFLLKLVPMYYPQYLTAEPIWWIPVLAGGYIVVFTVLGLVLYQKRDVERAGDVVAFSWTCPVFLYGVTFCVMLMGTVFITAMSGAYRGTPSLLVLLLFALIGYAVAKMLILKSFRILKYYKGFVAFAVLVILTFFVIDFNLIGFGTRVPDAEVIEKAFVGDFPLSHWHERAITEGSGNEGVAILRQQPEIDMVRKLQAEFAQAGKLKADERIGTQKLYVSYQLKNGRIITRAYDGKAEKLYGIFNTDAAKDSMYPYFRLQPEKIRYLTIFPNNGDRSTYYGENKEALIRCIRADLSSLSYEEISSRYQISVAAGMIDEPVDVDTKERITVYSMEVGVTTPEGKEHVIWFQFNENFTETLTWMQNKGLLS